MIQLLFSVRYLSQLRRVRPRTIAALESEVIRSIRDSLGVIHVEGGVIRANFDEDTPAFWLDLIVALEGIAAAVAGAVKELYGYACLVQRSTGGPDTRPAVLRELSRRGSSTGIWCDEYVSLALSSYAFFESAVHPESSTHENRGDGVRTLSAFRLAAFSSAPESKGETDLVGQLRSILSESEGGSSTCIVLLGETFRGRRSALRAAVKDRLGTFPPYFVRFGAGGTGIACLADAVGREVITAVDALGDGRREQSEARAELLRAIEAERLRAEPPAALAADFARFLKTFARDYVAASRARSAPAIFVLEDFHRADALAAKLAVDVFGRLAASNDAVIILTVPKADALKDWRNQTTRVVRLSAPSRDGDEASSPSLSDDLMEYLYALSLLEPLFAPPDLMGMFALEGKPARSLEHTLTVLSEYQAIESPEDPSPILPEYLSKVESKLGLKAERVRSFVRRRLLAAVSSGRAHPSFGLLSALSSLGGECDDDLALNAVEAESGAGTMAALDRIFASEYMASVLGKRREPLAYIARARCILRGSDEVAAREVFAAPFPEWFPSARYRGAALADLAAFFLGVCDIAGAEARVKESILLLQDHSDSRGLARAYRLLGLVELAKERVSEAIDYFSFAQEGSAGTAEDDEATIDAAYAASAEFIWGNTAKAERHALSTEIFASRAFRSDWVHWARFFRGRLRFEAGCYRDAMELFDSILTAEGETLGEDERRTVASWSFRARVYGAIPHPPTMDRIEEDGDGGLFLLESLYFSQDYRSSIELADKLLSRTEPRPFSSPERPNWTSGFSLVEDIVLPATTARRRLVRVLRALSLSALARDASSRAEAVEELRILVKDEKLTQSDPYDSLYYHAYCKSLEAASAPAVDVGTALSVAFQRVQRRASRIDDAEAKRAYLYLNRWNAALLAEAKSHNLI